MKRMVALVGVVGLLGTGGCAERVARAEEKKGDRLPVVAGDPRAMARSDLGFGLRMLTAWCREDPAKNIVFSPAGLAGGLGMALLGAQGKTAGEMRSVLGLPADPIPAMRGRTLALRGIPGVRTNDRIWIDASQSTEQGFLDRVATAYEAGVHTLPILGDPGGAARTINQQIADDTGGLIKDALKASLLGRAGWVLTDTVHLKADWADAFDPNDTAPGGFTTAGGQRAEVELLHGTRPLATSSADGWTSVTLPYKGNRLEAIALLPDGPATGDCPELTPRTVQRLADGPRRGAGIVLPKLDLGTRAEVKRLLAGLGMPTAFGSYADFSGISPDAAELLFVQHDARLKLGEKGTEAAAATEVGGGEVSAHDISEKVAFDRPFVLLIRDTETGEPLFLGRVADPAQR